MTIKLLRLTADRRQNFILPKLPLATPFIHKLIFSLESVLAYEIF
jgi:hypothetical protein